MKILKYTILAFVFLIVFGLLVGSAVRIFKPEWVRGLFIAREVDYNEAFREIVERTNRVVIRDGGYDCCSSIAGQKVLLEITEAGEVSAFLKIVRFVPGKYKEGSLCLCCGHPGIDFYQNEKRLALTAVQHGGALRWKGFSHLSLLGLRVVGYGDARFSEESKVAYAIFIKEKKLE